jgi:hypothetical protein
MPQDVERTGMLCHQALSYSEFIGFHSCFSFCPPPFFLRTCMPQDVERTGMLCYPALSYSELIGEPENIRTESAYKDVAQR